MEQKNNLRIQQIERQVSANKKAGRKPKTYNLIKKQPEDWGVPPEGEQFGICKECGKKFEQDYVGESNRYSNYPYCKKCTSKIRKTATKKAVDESDGNLVEGYMSKLKYTPYPWQKDAHKLFESHRFLVLACGARTGKDRFSNMAGILYFIDCLNENRHLDKPEMIPSVYWWIIAPTETVAKQNWREIKQFFPKDWIVNISSSTMTIQTIGNGIIEIRSAYDPEALVGVGLDLVTITEAARIKDLEIVWSNIEARLSSPYRGRAKDRMGKKYGIGKAIINSSPMGRNYFYKMWTWGQKNHPNYSSDWASMQLSTKNNPDMAELYSEKVEIRKGLFITREEDLRRRWGDRRFRQDFLGEFLLEGGKVYGEFKDKCLVNLFDGEFLTKSKKEQKEFVKDWQSCKPFHKYRLSWDIATGSSADEPTLGVRDELDYHIVRLISLYGKNYDAQYEEISYWSRYYNNAPCVFSSSGHTACVGQLAKLGVKEIVLTEQGSNKSALVQSLERATQNSAYKVLDDGSEEVQKMEFQMDDYAENNGKYSNDTEEHDDWVSMMYLMFYDYSVKEKSIPFVGRMSNLR